MIAPFIICLWFLQTHTLKFDDVAYKDFEKLQLDAESTVSKCFSKEFLVF